MTMRRSWAALLPACALAGMALAAPMAAASQAYPNRPVTLTTWSAAGGPIDTLARLLASGLSEQWGQPVVVENRTGASGTIAAQAVARAPADGYTLLLTTSTAHISNAILQPKLTYDPEHDFTPVAQVAAGTVLLLARADAPFDNLDELVAYARKQPDGMSFGSWGVGTSGHLYGELLKQKYDVPLLHVPYRGDMPASQDLLGGTLPLTFAGGTTARTLIESGRAKALGLTSAERAAALPQVPTFKEQGYDGFDLVGWAAIFAPAGVPSAIVEQIAGDVATLLQREDVRRKLSEMGQDAMYLPPAQFAPRIAEDFKRWGELIEQAGVKPE